MSKPKVYDSVKFSIFYSFILGLFPIYIGQTGKKILVKTNKFCSWISFIYSISFMVVLYIANLGFNPVTDSNVYNFNTLAKLLILVVTVVGDSGTCVLLIQGYFNKKYLKDFFNFVAEVDKTFLKCGYELKHRAETFIYSVISFSGPMMMVSFLGVMVWNIKRENLKPIPPPLLFCHIYSFTLVHHGESLFTICVIILRKRLQLVNLLLQRLDQKWLKKRQNRMGKFDVKNGISDLIKVSVNLDDERILEVCILIHDRLSDLCDIVRRVFGLVLIVGSIIQFNTVVFSFCYCYYNIFIRPVSSFGWFLWAVFRIYGLARKSFFAHMSTYEAQATLSWVTKLIMHSDNHHLEEKLKIFALQLKHRVAPITALGLFPIDGSYAFAVIGATTTYITIIYQFQVNKLGC